MHSYKREKVAAPAACRCHSSQSMCHSGAGGSLVRPLWPRSLPQKHSVTPAVYHLAVVDAGCMKHHSEGLSQEHRRLCLRPLSRLDQIATCRVSLLFRHLCFPPARSLSSLLSPSPFLLSPSSSLSPFPTSPPPPPHPFFTPPPLQR